MDKYLIHRQGYTTLNLKAICDDIKLTPRTLLEVGPAAPDENCRTDWYARNGYNCIFVEGNPKLCYYLNNGYEKTPEFYDNCLNIKEKLNHTYSGYRDNPNVSIHNAVIVDKPGKTKFYEFHASSFVGGTSSPAKTHDKYIENEKDLYIIDGFNINHFDNGEIDVLVSDTEGSDYYCIRDLISRPKVIILETHYIYSSYINPFINEINQWMKDNNYKEICKDQSDTLYIKE